jgi:hypothetical protein
MSEGILRDTSLVIGLQLWHASLQLGNGERAGEFQFSEQQASRQISVQRTDSESLNVGERSDCGSARASGLLVERRDPLRISLQITDPRFGRRMGTQKLRPFGTAQFCHFLPDPDRRMRIVTSPR